MEQRDQKLWRKASQRAAFRRNLYSYIIVNLFFWAIWWFTQGKDFVADGKRGIPWPCWVMLGWGLGLAFQYFKAYHGNRQDIAEEEYKKMVDQQDR